MFINHCSNNVRKIGTSYITKIKKKSQRKISARIERKREKKEEERERERGAIAHLFIQKLPPDRCDVVFDALH